MATIDELKQKNNELKQLLDDEQPGLQTWQHEVRTVVREMYEMCWEQKP